MTDYLEIAKNVKVSAKEAKEAKKGPVPEAPASVTDINTARTIQRGPDERRLIAAGWEPKERMGLVIWANPETGFWCSREVALHRLDNPLPEASTWSAEERGLLGRVRSGESAGRTGRRER